ncbi:group 1 glycosyl transferase [Methylovorus sp. MM2]|uniref:glycosyltransferase family 4 protein n=1 Tax=Methylovorus sp. MM2 TaxID=1848038 RepID=UPI0007E0A7F6|nr:glycosyltransferase family 4 protein [Methylovorus sp. MM2]OAM52502.1 group 1 glycosyl transferase [Methylovorus sp. MM2]
MKFAFLIFKYFPFGGVQRDMLRIASDCAKKGHQVTIYTGQWRGDMPDASINVVILPQRGIFNHQRHQYLIDEMLERVHIDKPDFVIGFNRMFGLDAYYAADPCFKERAHLDRSWWYRLGGRYRFFADSERYVMRQKSHCHILLLSPIEKPVFKRWYHTEDSRFHQLPPNIPVERFANIVRQDARSRLRHEFKLPQDANVVLFVGSAFVRKGLDRAIEALAKLPDEIRSKTWLLAVGEDEPEGMRDLAAKLKVASRVIVTDGRTDIPELMMGADLLAHPARSELAGLVIVEALTAGLPVLVTGNCGYAFHVADAKAGIVLASPYQQSDCDAALIKMLDRRLLDEFSDAGKRYTQNIADTTSLTYEADLIERLAAEKKMAKQMASSSEVD